MDGEIIEYEMYLTKLYFFIIYRESSETSSVGEKPWKQHNKHKNKGKKEKLRRVYAHLDQH